jgi:hypothetical protein
MVRSTTTDDIAPFADQDLKAAADGRPYDVDELREAVPTLNDEIETWAAEIAETLVPENHPDLSVIDASELPEGADILVSGRTGHEKTSHALEDEYLVCIAIADENDCLVYDGYASGPREYDVTNEVTRTDSLEDAIQKAASLLSEELS